MAEKLLHTIDEACARISVKRTTFYGLMASGEIESVKIGKARRIPAEALEDYVARVRDEAREAAGSSSDHYEKRNDDESRK